MIRLNADHIRQLRQERELSLDELSAAVNIDKRTLAAWESGSAQDAWIVKFARLAHYYGLQLNDLLIMPEQPIPSVSTPTPAQAPA